MQEFYFFLKKITIFLLAAIISMSIIATMPKNYIAKTDFIILIKQGSGKASVSKVLKDNGVIDHPFIFQLAYKIKNTFSTKKKIKAGGFKIEKGMNYYEIIDLISSNKYYTMSVTFPEGLTKFQMLEILAKSNAQGEITENVEEGYLMPETYSYNLLETKNDIIKRMKKDMSDLLQKAWSENKNPAIKTKEELLIFASIIEKEVNSEEEFPIVASVFTNRLMKNMKLQSCPTAIYDITKGETSFSRALTYSDTKIGKYYNTYLLYGLPKGPICSPSKKAIMASINPSQTDYLYFVAIGDGSKRHNFSKTYDEHKENVSSYRQIRAEGEKK